MFDCHVHAAPDIVDRLGDDRDILQTYEQAGASGGQASRWWSRT